MAVGVQRTQAGISISIARDPSLVRTVRLVAAAVARRTGSGEDLVEEVRMAVGEACAVMVTGLAGHPIEVGSDKVHLHLDIGDRLHLEMSCAGRARGGAAYDGNAVDPWALLRGLADDVSVQTSNGLTTVSMSWPI